MMKRIMVAVLAAVLMVGFNAMAFAGDAPKGGDTKTETKGDAKGGEKKGEKKK
jgi:hypothetical protein